MRKKIQISYFLRVTQLLQLTGSTYNFVIKKLRWDGCFTVTLALRSVLHPDVFWYRLNGIGTQKSSCNTFSIYISCKNKMKYSLQILKKKNLFKRHKYFWTLIYNHWVFLSITKLSNP